MLAGKHKLERNSIILYGAGYAGLHFCDLLLQVGIKPVMFYDADIKKQGKTWNNIEIRNLDTEKYVDRNALVIVCMLRKDELYITITKQLKEKGFDKLIHMQDVQTDHEYSYLFKNQNLILHADKNIIEKNRDKIKDVRCALENEGKKIYDEIFAHINSDFSEPINSLPIEEQYWAYDLFTKNKQEIVFDCGAFDGTVMHEFIKKNSNYRAYYAFEPDKANADRIPDKKEKNINVICKALSNSDHEIVSMRNYMNMNSVIVDDGDFEVECMCLDDMKVVPTFIKIDVEGYEEKVIEGGRKLIKSGRPVIACAMYHSIEQLWNVPKMIMEMTSINYSYYVRSYMNLYETIFYAIPNERKR